MKNIKILFLILNFWLLITNSSFSQNITADTTLANQYVDNAKKNLAAQKFDSAMLYLDKAQPLYIKHLGEKILKNANIILLKGNINLYLAKFDSAIIYYFTAVQICKDISHENHKIVANSYNNIGICYQYMNEYDKSMEYYLKSLTIRKSILGEKHPDVAASYNNIGAKYFEKGEFTKALEYYLKSINILDEKHIFIADSYNNIGLIYKEKTEYDKTLEYLLKSLAIRKELLGENHTLVAASYNNIGMVYEAKNEWEKALEYHLKSVAIKKELLSEKHTDVATSYYNIGSIYEERNEFEKALEFYFKSLAIRKELLGEKHIDAAKCYNSIGSVYNSKKDYNKALVYFFNCLSLQKQVFNEKHNNVTSSYNNIGLVYKNNKEYLKALKNYQKAIASCLLNFNDTVNIYSVPKIENYTNWNELLKALQVKSQILASTNVESNRNKALKFALHHYQACDTLIDLTRKDINKQSDKFALGDRAREIYNEVIQVCEILKVNSEKLKDKRYYSELAFYFSEKTKSSVLLEALAGKEAQKFAGIPESLLQKEQKLKVDIAFYTKQLASPENLDSAKTLLFQNELFRNNRSYDSLIITFENQFPEYHTLKYNNKVVSVNELQQNVLHDGKTAIISYVVGDSAITIFTVTKNTFDVQHVVRPKKFTDTVQYFCKSLTKSTKQLRSAYKRIAYNMYELLIPKNINKHIENLIIIPDNVLATIPFEALITKNIADTTQFQNLPYLIRNFNISYSYSATLLNRTFPKKNLQNIEITPLNDWIAFAPVFDDDKTKGTTLASRELITQLRTINKDTILSRAAFLNSGDDITPLPGTESEVISIFNQFDALKYKAKVELRGNTTEQYIKSGILQDCKIIHFATHGFVNSEKPELSGIVLAQDSAGGEDGVLYSGEIFNLKIKADLVVLSACETGLGKINEGEGIIGLTRALLYAGSKNIIVSLWQVSDESTSDLMINFYKNLLENNKKQNYSKNLRNAKLKMIKEGKFAHPYYWSPFILIGK